MFKKNSVLFFFLLCIRSKSVGQIVQISNNVGLDEIQMRLTRLQFRQIENLINELKSSYDMAFLVVV